MLSSVMMSLTLSGLHQEYNLINFGNERAGIPENLTITSDSIAPCLQRAPEALPPDDRLLIIRYKGYAECQAILKQDAAGEKCTLLLLTAG
jgi:hypothetical protein